MNEVKYKPDYFKSKEEFLKYKFLKINTNKRYRFFNQTHYTAGDEEQFKKGRNYENGTFKDIKLKENIYNDFEIDMWKKNTNLSAMSVSNTFNYIFNKFKKEIYIKILDNKLKVFLPFSKKNYINEWSKYIEINPVHGNMYNFIRYINNMTKERRKISVNRITENWYGNNSLIRFEFPINEGDTNICNMRDMLITLCENRELPDIECFINRRDFPILKNNDTEAYDHLFGNNTPLVSNKYDTYSPILSMCTTNEFADITIPTGDDWARVSYKDGKLFGPNCTTYEDKFDIKWKNKKPTAVFRGSSTGSGIEIETNPRLKLAKLSEETREEEGELLLDAGITKWQLRPRKLNTHRYLQTIDINKIGIKLKEYLSPKEQSEYKYIINVDGHVTAFRLSYELSMGCCILMVESNYTIWYKKLLKPYKHYIPIKRDLSDLLEKIRWCRRNDLECKKISKRGKKFYKKYLQKNGILDYMQKIFIEIKKKSGVYLYNITSPLQYQIKLEEKYSDLYYPITKKTVSDINYIPSVKRSTGLLKGMRWIINMINKKSDFVDIAEYIDTIYKNKSDLNQINKYKLAGFNCVIKSSEKYTENIHEYYIGVNVINDLLKYTPNFAYIFGILNYSIIMEYVEGITLEKWIQSDEFNMKDYLFILFQLSLSLEIAQKKCNFIHYDLTTWNIMIKKLSIPFTFDYYISYNNIVRLTTNVLPIIIDYGKSHVIYNNIHYGFVNMYNTSTIQDIISILLTSVFNIISRPNITNKEVDEIIIISNFLSGTKYRNNPFLKTGPKGISDVHFFFNNSKKYNNMVYSDKGELENKTPLDFIRYIIDNFNYNFDYKNIECPIFNIDNNNPFQVFQYILSNNEKERIDSYIDVFKRIYKTEFPSIKYNFLKYYTIQVIENNLKAVNDEMKLLYGNKYDKYYIKAINKLRDIYNCNQIYTYSDNITYIINRQIDNIEYNEFYKSSHKILLLPEKLEKIIEKYKHIKCIDLNQYKLIIESILCNNGIFKLSDEIKEYYIKHFNSLLNMNSVNINSNISDILTLYKISLQLYNENIEYLLGIKDKSDEINNYIIKYTHIIKKIKNNIKLKKITLK